MTLNATPSQTTKYSPHEILFGRKMVFPSSVVVDSPLYPQREPTTKEVKQYVIALEKFHKEVHP